MRKVIFGLVLGLVLTSSTSLAGETDIMPGVERTTPRSPSSSGASTSVAPTFAFARAMGATAAVFTGDVMPGVSREPRLAVVLLPLGGR